jgi:putative FmdB family regulatory protein
MPTYDLACRSCGNRFERFMTRLIRDDDKVCPECGSTEVSQGIGGGYAMSSRGADTPEACVPRGGFG